jgi:hypothetical protein
VGRFLGLFVGIEEEIAKPLRHRWHEGHGKKNAGGDADENDTAEEEDDATLIDDLFRVGDACLTEQDEREIREREGDEDARERSHRGVHAEYGIRSRVGSTLSRSFPTLHRWGENAFGCGEEPDREP